MNWLYQKEEHMTRFFNTKWNSKISLKRWHKKHHEKGLYFRDGYIEFRFNSWCLRYRNGK